MTDSWKIGYYVLLGVVVIPSLLYWYTRINIPKVSLDKCRVLITGGSEGIGYEIAKYCLEKGSDIILLARNEDKLANAYESLCEFKQNEEQVIGIISADVSNYSHLKHEIETTLEEYLDWDFIDCIICNAGVEYVGSLEDTALEHHKCTMDVNYYGIVHCLKIALPYLKKHETKCGRVIVLGSMASLLWLPYQSAYCASKFAVRGFIESIAPAFAAYNIYSSIVYPPNVKTAQLKREHSATNIPLAIAELSRESDVFEAAVVGRDIARMIENGTFCRSWGIDGWMITNLTAGFSIPNCYLDVMAQVFLSGIFRMISMWYSHKFYTVSKRNTKIQM